MIQMIRGRFHSVVRPRLNGSTVGQTNSSQRPADALFRNPGSSGSPPGESSTIHAGGLMDLSILVVALAIAFATQDAVASALPREETLAATKLRRSTVFTTAQVGLGRVTTDEAIAFRQLLIVEADSTFQELARRGTSAGRLYGLCGLKALDDPAYRSSRTRMARRRDRVRAAGCIAPRTSVDKVLAVHKTRAGDDTSDFDRICQTLIAYALEHR